MPWMNPGPLKSCMVPRQSSLPVLLVKTSSAFPASGTRYSQFLYTSPYACLPMWMGFFQDLTAGKTFLTNIGALNTVPSRAARMVPLGLLHSCFSPYSFTLSLLGVIVAHLTPTPYCFMASAAFRGFFLSVLF